jgi:hypothetical protein
MLPVSLDCPFLIAPSVFSNVYCINPEKLATYGIQNENKQDKNTTQYVLDTTIRKQTQMT